MPPNILLVVFDTARADAFEPYGAPAGTTPAVTQLASRGVAVEHVSATACWTLPSHVSMFSGALPRAVGVAEASSPLAARGGVESLADRMLPGVLRRAGYTTRAASTNVWVSRTGGFATGFDEFRDLQGNRQERLATGRDLLGRARWAFEAARARADDGAADAREAVEGWIRTWAGEPSFWFVNLVECHSPYLPPRPYNDLSRLDRMRAANEAQRHLRLVPIWRTCLGEFDIPDGALERMRHLYVRSIAYLDAWLAAILEALDSKGMLDETLVVVTSDHGENFGEGGLIAHALSLDERLLHVPFVAAGPGAERLANVRSLAQLAATLAEVAELDAHPWAADELPEGVGLAQFEPPGGGASARAAEAIREWGLGQDAYDRFTTPLATASDGRTKLLRRGHVVEVFDLAADPLELSPTPLESAPDVPEALLEGLDHASTRVVPTVVGEAPAAPGTDVSELEDRMRTLGYL